MGAVAGGKYSAGRVAPCVPPGSGQGAPAPAQVQALAPSQGRSGWFSQTSRSPRERRTSMSFTLFIAVP
jgi:hypothetical protein